MFAPSSLCVPVDVARSLDDEHARTLRWRRAAGDVAPAEHLHWLLARDAQPLGVAAAAHERRHAVVVQAASRLGRVLACNATWLHGAHTRAPDWRWCWDADARLGGARFYVLDVRALQHTLAAATRALAARAAASAAPPPPPPPMDDVTAASAGDRHKLCTADERVRVLTFI